jgi:hypothetical protein
MKLIFEIRDLKFATPATATRAGILYISEDKQWENMVASWISRVAVPYAAAAKWKDPTQPVKWLKDMFERYEHLLGQAKLRHARTVSCSFACLQMEMLHDARCCC